MMRSLIGLSLVLCLSACGVSVQDEATRLPEALVPSAAARPPSTGEAAGNQRLILWFVEGDRLVPEFSQLTRRTDVAGILAGLASGSVDEDAPDRRTLVLDPISGIPLVTVGSETGEEPVSVVLEQGFVALLPDEQVLLLGQVVLSLSGAGYGEVAFVDSGGGDLAVPLPDGSLRTGAVRLDDYRRLTSGR